MLCLHAITDEDGHPLEDEDESGGRHCEYGGTSSQVRAEPPRHRQYQEVFRYIQKAPVDMNWTIGHS